MDALAHNLEAYCAPGFHPMADGIALEGMRLIDKWLLVAVKDGTNIDARMNMLTAVSIFIRASIFVPSLTATSNHLSINLIPSKAIPSAIG